MVCPILGKGRSRQGGPRGWWQEPNHKNLRSGQWAPASSPRASPAVMRNPLWEPLAPRGSAALGREGGSLSGLGTRKGLAQLKVLSCPGRVLRAPSSHWPPTLHLYLIVMSFLPETPRTRSATQIRASGTRSPQWRHRWVVCPINVFLDICEVSYFKINESDVAT